MNAQAELTAGTADTPVEQVYSSRAQLPESPPAGTYIVVDVAHFSTTVVELFERGAEYIHITEQRGDEHRFKQAHPDAKIGGGKTPEYEPAEGYDFFNSPGYVQSVDVDGRPTAMTSTNGGAAVTELRHRGGEDVTVFVGGLRNAAAVSAHVGETPEPTYLVAAGSKGNPSPEDTVGAAVIGQYINGEPPSDNERRVYRNVAYYGKAPKYDQQEGHRLNDLVQYDLQFNESSVVPKLEGQKLYNISK